MEGHTPQTNLEAVMSREKGTVTETQARRKCLQLSQTEAKWRLLEVAGSGVAVFTGGFSSQVEEYWRLFVHCL